ncbi:neuferricin-like [Patiria miniata]|uniref:Cytochrome b5 heme-binding domain-containing protein n=1 Tax=Patiria miniata TaxID=46514 RepID=A0A914A5X9_PATMI|nr:neuferricin-like [Patiria miniata]XP_038059271.1 neuferricin-like [Patiria miniata]XP_038059272.1 neuferricin-like [Patiria miniata]XP_038059273.1 neuferricin-like [Patiria miniata]XP_038059274.1 neuferricin-like [Patiria miniata]
MFGRVALAVVITAVIAWQLEFYKWEDISAAITRNLNNVIGHSEEPGQQEGSKEEAKAPLPPQVEQPQRLLTKEELAQYNGKEGSKGLYLALFGQVFDVGKGARHYGPGGGYEFFAGCDATRAFVTGEFNDEGLVDDVEGLSPQQMIEVETWVNFYKKEYVPVGKLIGRHYDASGAPTDAFKRAELVLEEGRKEKEKEAEFNRKYPPCNSSWTQKDGTKIWCSDKSGGIVRKWAGVPRRYFTPGSSNWRCVCVQERDLDNPHMRLFNGCGPKDASCYMDRK